MKPIYSTTILLIINVLSISFIIFTNLKADEATKFKFINEPPTRISAEIRPILIRGEVKKEGLIYVNLNNEIIPTLTQLDLFNPSTDISKATELYKNKLFNEFYTVFIPPTGKEKIYLNFSSQKDLSEYFGIDLHTSAQIIDKRPYILLKDFENQFPNIEIRTESQLIL